MENSPPPLPVLVPPYPTPFTFGSLLVSTSYPGVIVHGMGSRPVQHLTLRPQPSHCVCLLLAVHPPCVSVSVPLRGWGDTSPPNAQQSSLRPGLRPRWKWNHLEGCEQRSTVMWLEMFKKVPLAAL